MNAPRQGLSARVCPPLPRQEQGSQSFEADPAPSPYVSLGMGTSQCWPGCGLVDEPGLVGPMAGLGRSWRLATQQPGWDMR